MNEENICKFIPATISHFNIDTKNFVFEKKAAGHTKLVILSAYIIYLVTDGSGLFHTTRCCAPLSRGSLFVTFPATPFCIENTGGLQYLYITALGLRFNELVERSGITREYPFFSGYEELIPFWIDCLEQSSEANLDLISESVLLYTFSHLCKNKTTSEVHTLIPGVKKYIDENYGDETLSLKSLSEAFRYNPKYISSLFKRELGLGVCDYLNMIRVQHACELIQKGICSVKELAGMTGFSDPTYFSKVFRKRMLVSPTEFIRSVPNH